MNRIFINKILFIKIYPYEFFIFGNIEMVNTYSSLIHLDEHVHKERSIKRLFHFYACYSSPPTPVSAPQFPTSSLPSLHPGCTKCQLFSVFPSTEGAWEDTLNFLLNAIIIKSIRQKSNP